MIVIVNPYYSQLTLGEKHDNVVVFDNRLKQFYQIDDILQFRDHLVYLISMNDFDYNYFTSKLFNEYLKNRHFDYDLTSFVINNDIRFIHEMFFEFLSDLKYLLSSENVELVGSVDDVNDFSLDIKLSQSFSNIYVIINIDKHFNNNHYEMLKSMFLKSYYDNTKIHILLNYDIVDTKYDVISVVNKCENVVSLSVILPTQINYYYRIVYRPFVYKI